MQVFRSLTSQASIVHAGACAHAMSLQQQAKKKEQESCCTLWRLPSLLGRHGRSPHVGTCGLILCTWLCADQWHGSCAFQGTEFPQASWPSVAGALGTLLSATDREGPLSVWEEHLQALLSYAKQAGDEKQLRASLEKPGSALVLLVRLTQIFPLPAHVHSHMPCVQHLSDAAWHAMLQVLCGLKAELCCQARCHVT